MKNQHYTIFGLLLLLACSARAQLDTKHYIPPFFAKVEDNSGTENIRKHFVSLSTPSEETIDVTIRNGYGELIDIVSISRDAPAEYVFAPLGNATGNPATAVYPLNVIPRDSLNTPIRSQGLYFESFKPFFVNMRHKSGSQGTSLTSKGQVALGTRFYSGHLYTIYNTTSPATVWNNSRRSHFISVMATEDSTTVTFDLIKSPISYIGQTPGEPITVVLDAFESYVLGVDHALYDNASINNANGTRITSDKPIACNTGSWLSGNTEGQCIGSDQLVPAANVGQEYILVKGLGDESTERPMVVATEDNTLVFLNGSTTAADTLDEGEFYFVPTAEFTANGNLYILASEKVYVFQTLSGSAIKPGPTVGLNFIPPLNCVGAKEVNLPFVNSLASGDGQGRINIITKTGTSIYVNESPTPISGAQPVTGNPDWVTYAFDPPSNNVIIESDSVMNVALLTRDDNVGTAGYFSGFTLEPVVGLSSGTEGTSPCIPGNALLEVFGFDTYQWYFNGEEIPGATGSSYFPEFAGNYSVDGIDLACGFRFRSNQFDIPYCATDLGVSKQVQVVAETAPGSKIFDISYRVFIENLNPSPAPNIQIIENITGGLPVGATAELLTAPSITFGVLTGGVNPDFDGVTDRRLLPGSGTLLGGGVDAIDFTIRVDMNAAEQDGYFDQVTATGKNTDTNNGVDGPFNGQDFSDDGANPDPDGDGNPNEDGENDPTLTCFFTHEISYADSSFCVSTDSVAVAVDGVNAGIFTTDLSGLAIDSLSGTIYPAASDPGTYTVTFSSGGRCPDTTTTVVQVVAVPSSGTPTAEAEICITEEAVLADYLEGEDPQGVWTDDEGQEVPALFQPSIPGNFEFTYSITAAPCAVQSTTFTLEVVGEPQPGTPDTDIRVCVNAESVDLSTYIEGEQPSGVWTDAQGTTIPAVLSPDSAGVYTYTYTVSNDACGPRSTDILVEVLALPNAGLAADTPSVCVGAQVDLNSFLTDEDAGGAWQDSNGSPVASTLVPSAEGLFSYSYIVSNPACPADTSRLLLEVSPGPSAGTAENPVAICLNSGSINLFSLLENASPGGSWTDADSAAVPATFNPSTSGTFAFTYTVSSPECGAIATELTLEVNEQNCTGRELIIPEGFSPNGDGTADQWNIRGLDQYPNNALIIFNRWGNEIYSARPYANDWNGTAQRGINAGAQVPVGTYWYILDLGDGSDVRKGYVYINR